MILLLRAASAGTRPSQFGSGPAHLGLSAHETEVGDSNPLPPAMTV
jgi:hypothetical protein